MKWCRLKFYLFLLLLCEPISILIGAQAVADDWRSASRESSLIAPRPETTPEAVVQVYSARAFSWRGIFAVHTWISLKPKDSTKYTVYEVVGWHTLKGDSVIQIHQNEPDRYWYGARPKILSDLRGAEATEAIKGIKAAAAAYPYANTYTTWPGPNSNTFTAFIVRHVPELRTDLPPLAIGKDFLPRGKIFSRAPSGRGIQISILGVLGILISVNGGVEFNLLSLSFGIDPGDLAIRLPIIGKIGLR
jgi:hypothetical protein